MIIVGEPESKRTIYMKHAARKRNVNLSCISYKDGYEAVLEQIKCFAGTAQVVKLDPPQFFETEFDKMQCQLLKYRDFLEKAGQLPLHYLNSPHALLEVMDKRLCKQRLMDAGLPVTEMVFGRISSVEELLGRMETQKIRNVFIKPAIFSGASGVSALCRNPKTGQLVLRTTCFWKGDGLVNTKKLFRIEEPARVYTILEHLFQFEPVIEKWIPKDKYHGMDYDLRVVWQFDRMEHIVVRTSKGPITNLHLNNQPENLSVLGLSGETMEEIRNLCQRSAALFPGLKVSGMDVLLQNGTRKPRLIEINGQGDLIYQDIYQENRIYTGQLSYASMHGGSLKI